MRDVIYNENPIVFDVGANVGGYTLELLKLIPNAYIHSFEPTDETFHTLSERVRNAHVILNHFGLSDEISESTLLYDEENSTLASLYKRQSPIRT